MPTPETTTSKPASAANPNVISYDGAAAALDAATVQAALKAGKTLAIKNATAGQLADLHIGIDVTHNAALFAIKQNPILGHPGRLHTIITIIPEGTAEIESQSCDDTGKIEKSQQTSALVADAVIDQEIQRHVDLQLMVSNGLVPPTGTYFGVVTYVIPNPGGTLTQNFWSDNNGTTQTYSASNTDSFYCYLVEATPGNYTYSLINVKNGSINPVSSSGGLCCPNNNSNACCFVTGFYNVNTQAVTSGITLLNSSPSTTTVSPVNDSISAPLTIVGDFNGGTNTQSFTAAYANAVDNSDWGVSVNTAGSNAAWNYYNITGWNALTDTFNSFGTWWSQMYDGSDNVIKLDNTCTSGSSFETISLWSVSTPSASSSLTVEFELGISAAFQGFANASGTGNGHHQIYQIWPSLGAIAPQFDLSVVTGANSIT